MNDLNHVVLIGRLTQDAELKYTQNGYASCVNLPISTTWFKSFIAAPLYVKE